jgi:hypothetical protein
MPAAANLSECQLNCLGLSVWLMQATTPGSPFDFIMLDDPVQSMDDDHAESFMASVIPHLLNKSSKQVIVLSHVKRITDRLRDLNLGRPHRVYHLENYTQSGPVVVEQIKFAKQLSEIKGGAAGNDANRIQAVDRLRVLIEDLVRELHLQMTMQPLPAEFDNAGPADLLRAFRSIPGTTAQEHGDLGDSINFCHPAHHTKVGYAPPTTSGTDLTFGTLL